MRYIKRELERKFLKMNQAFKAIMVTGARQVGKTTMLKHLAASEKRTFVTMDDPRNRALAEEDPALFFQVYQPPVLIDEVQKAPKIFEKIKEICDASEQNGLFWLTGSESRKLIREAGDTLAGRICILKMYGLSQREKNGLAELGPLDFSVEALLERERYFSKNDIHKVYSHIWEGGYPGTVEMDEEQLIEYYSSYIDTYLMRDAADDNNISDIEGFRKVLTACTAFIGSLINYSDLAAAGGVSVPTVKKWVGILQNMGIITLLQPYASNTLKRLVKTPKLYFCDTGLASYLSMWTSKEVLMTGAASGHFFENYVVEELLRGYAASDKRSNMTFYRDTNQKEIDIIIEDSGMLISGEIKRATNPNHKMIKNFKVMRNAEKPVGMGVVFCMAEKVFPIDRENWIIPCQMI